MRRDSRSMGEPPPRITWVISGGMGKREWGVMVSRQLYRRIAGYLKKRGAQVVDAPFRTDRAYLMAKAATST